LVPAGRSGPRAIQSLSPRWIRPLPCSIGWVTVAISPTSRAPRRFISGSELGMPRSPSMRRAVNAAISDRNTKSITCSGTLRPSTKVSAPVTSAAIPSHSR